MGIYTEGNLYELFGREDFSMPQDFRFAQSRKGYEGRAAESLERIVFLSSKDRHSQKKSTPVF
jgi:hypothetical protein